MRDVWYCEPQKNKECRKTGCYLNGGPCHMTMQKEYALVVNGEPLKGPDVEGTDNGTV